VLARFAEPIILEKAFLRTERRDCGKVGRTKSLTSEEVSYMKSHCCRKYGFGTD
jgi:hypothetical protein